MTASPSLVRGTKSSTAYTVKPVVQIRTGLYEDEVASLRAKANKIESLAVEETKAGQYLRFECDECQSIEKTNE